MPWARMLLAAHNMTAGAFLTSHREALWLVLKEEVVSATSGVCGAQPLAYRPSVCSLSAIFVLQETDSEKDEEDYTPKRPVLSRLQESPSDIIAVLITMLDLLDLTRTDLSPMPPRALTKPKKRLKALLSGLFPGIAHPDEAWSASPQTNDDAMADSISAWG